VHKKFFFKVLSLIELHESIDASRFILRTWGRFNVREEIQRGPTFVKPRKALGEDFSQMVELNSQLSFTLNALEEPASR
jgi:hypothetical protein